MLSADQRWELDAGVPHLAWEVRERSFAPRWEARLIHRDVGLVAVSARWRWLLLVRMWWALGPAVRMARIREAELTGVRRG